MRIKGIEDEDFINYKLPSMFIITSFCNFKCEKESGVDCCQNSSLAHTPIAEVDDDIIIRRYLNNPISKAIVFGGLEPFEQFDEVLAFIRKLRMDYRCNDTVVIYTGYYKNEILSQISKPQQFKNIIVKYGRYVPNKKRHFDKVLGVYLASDNQYAEVIS